MNERAMDHVRIAIQEIDTVKPHKLVALLVVVNLFDRPAFRKREIRFGRDFIDSFSVLISAYGGENDRDRAHTPFFHLRSHGFWKLRAREGKAQELLETSTVGGAGKLNELVECAELSEDLFEALVDPDSREDLRRLIVSILEGRGKMFNVSNVCQESCNEFVGYLNTMCSIHPNGDGALAESQARTPLFSEIHVEHPWVERIVNILNSSGGPKHVLLTGHAGDGKSTIALELHRRLSGINQQYGVDHGIGRREDIGESISIVKDLSEWRIAEQDDLLKEMTVGRRRFVLVANTGCLLNLFKRNSPTFMKTELEIETEFLDQIAQPERGMLELSGVSVCILNSSLYDNLPLALKVFERMVCSNRWDVCACCRRKGACPIIWNLGLIKSSLPKVVVRLHLLFMRAYEYGDRLTMRQFTSHFAYMITCGYACSAISERIGSDFIRTPEKYMFVNRFWGDNGWESDSRATQLRSVQVVRRQAFGRKSTPAIEGRLWTNRSNESNHVHVSELTGLIQRLQKIGSGSSPNAERARLQVRRLIYFFFDSEDDQVLLRRFQCAFLNSQSLIDLHAWRNSQSQFRPHRSALMNSLFQVLQEQYSGIRFPGGKVHDWALYITLNRRQNDVRQSSQVVLGRLDFKDSFEVVIEQYSLGQAPILLLRGTGRFEGLQEQLALPLLDFIQQRKDGEIGNALQISYVDRLENFKCKILERCIRTDGSELRLVRVDHSGRLQRQTAHLLDGRLEVTNA